MTEAQNICNIKKLNLQDQVAALAIIYNNKSVGNPTNLLLKILRSGGCKATEIIKDSTERLAKKEWVERAKTEKRRKEDEEIKNIDWKSNKQKVQGILKQFA